MEKTLKSFFLILLLSILTTTFLNSNENEQKKAYILSVLKKIDEIKFSIPNVKNPIKEYTQIAHLYLEIEYYDNAIEYFYKAISLEPTNPNLYYMLALIYEKKNDKIKAIENWQNVIKFSKNKKLIEIALKHIEILTNSR